MKNILVTLLLIGGLSSYSFSQTPYPNLVDQPDLFEFLPEPVLVFLNQYLPMAAEVSQVSGVPIDFLLCVSGLETGWGRSELAREANNLFGIKNPYQDGPSHCILHEDFVPGVGIVTEYECFKKYESVVSSFQDYLTHMEMRGCYLDIQADLDSGFDEWVTLVEDCGYATDPDYGEKLYNIRQKYSFLRLIPPQYLDEAYFTSK